MHSAIIYEQNTYSYIFERKKKRKETREEKKESISNVANECIEQYPVTSIQIKL